MNTTPKPPTSAQTALIAKLVVDLDLVATEYDPATKAQASQLIDMLLTDSKAKREVDYQAKLAARKIAEADLLACVPTWAERLGGQAGKVTDTFTCLMAKRNDFGQVKMLCTDPSGRKLWVSAPKALQNAVCPSWCNYVGDGFEPAMVVGASFEFTVAVATKPGEDHFAFGTRPAYTPASLVKATVAA